MIRLSHLSKTFDGGRSYAVKDLTLAVKQGETLVLLGSSGYGQTATLTMINRLIEPTEGIIEIGATHVKVLDPISVSSCSATLGSSILDTHSFLDLRFRMRMTAEIDRPAPPSAPLDM